MSGTGKYYNNGIKNIRIKEGEPVPEGFIQGMKPRSNESKAAALQKRKQTNLERYGSEFPLQSNDIKENMKKNSLKKWGTEHPMQSKEMKDKYKELCKKNYGVENISQSLIIKDKKRRTSLERYGTEHPMQSKEIQNKSKRVFLEKYGVDNPFKSEEVKIKSITTLKENYGVEHPLQSEIIRDKAKKSILDHYGVENPMKSDEIREKSKETNIKNYGTESVFKSEHFKDKSRHTSLEKYGTEYPNQSEEVKQKIRDTNLERYGVPNAMQSEEVKENLRKSNVEKYNVDNVLKSEEVRNKAKKTSFDKYGVEYPTQSNEWKEKASSAILEKYGVKWNCMLPQARLANKDGSGPNKEFASMLEREGISYKREFPLGRYSFDFKVNKTLIEINPTVTHNTIFNPFSERCISEDYHQKKSLTAEENGYRVIHVFDWDDKNKIISLLKSSEILYARKLKVFGISMDEVHSFLNEHHLQGSCNGQKICLGLRDEYGELISLMTFGKPRYNKNYQWELLRYCSSKNIIGGAEKLFKHFIKTYSPKNIISYCDRSKFRGDVYEKLGFKLYNNSKPSRHWYSSKASERMQHITDNLLRQRGYDQLFNEHYGKGTSNEELIIKKGYLPVYDCGQDTYVWNNK